VLRAPLNGERRRRVFASAAGRAGHRVGPSENLRKPALRDRQGAGDEDWRLAAKVRRRERKARLEGPRAGSRGDEHGHWKRRVFGSADAVCFPADTRLRFFVDGRERGVGVPVACQSRHYGRLLEVFGLHSAVADLLHLKGCRGKARELPKFPARGQSACAGHAAFICPPAACLRASRVRLSSRTKLAITCLASNAAGAPNLRLMRHRGARPLSPVAQFRTPWRSSL